MASLRQLIAKPWQRMAVGVVVIIVGLLVQNYVITAFGVVFVVLPLAGWIKRGRGGRVEKSDGSPQSAEL